MTESGPRLSEVVQTRYEFTGFVQLSRAFEPEYRRACRAQFLPTETENRIFRAVVRAAQGNLDQGRRNLLLVSPFGTGKSLDLVMAYDIFSSKGNAKAVEGFDQAVRSDLLALTSQGPYLMVPVVGTESPMPLSQAILGAFRRAVATQPFFKDTQKTGAFLVRVEYEQAALWLAQVSDGKLGHLRDPLETFLRSHPSDHTLTSLRKALGDSDPAALETWRAAFEAVTGQPPSDFGVATPRDVFDHALPELEARGIVGIALLIDELSQYLRLYPQYEAEAIRTLDPLIHWIHDHEPCFSIVASQVIPERLQGETDADYQAWASLRGRFHVVQMERQRYDGLIGKALTRLPNPPTDPDKHPQMGDLRQAHMTCFTEDDRATAQRAIAAYYPFHPTVVAAIGAVADTLGQFERSIFQYLDRTTGGGFRDFVEARSVYLGVANDRLELITLDEVFRFFARDWSKLEGVNDSLAQASRQAEAAIQGSDLARRVLNLVTLLAFIEGRAPLPTPDVNGIAQMLDVPVDDQLEEVLQRFVSEAYFMHDGTTGYSLLAAGGPRPKEVLDTIQKHITQDTQPITGTTVKNYLAQYSALATSLRRQPAPPFPLEATYDVTVKNVLRSFTREFVTGRELVQQSSALRQGATAFGRLLIGVITAADNADGKQYQEAVSAAKKLSEAGAIVALVRQPLDAFTKPVKRYKAARAVADDLRLGTSELAAKEREDALHELLAALSAQYQVHKLNWHTPASPTTPVRFTDAGSAVEAAAKELSRKFPGGILSPDLVGGNSLDKVIRPLLDGGGPIELRGKPGDVFVYALQPLGVVTIGPKTKDPKRVITLTEPDSSKEELTESAGIWHIVAKALGEWADGDAVYRSLQVLRRPPYWCPENLIVYLLAAYMGMHGATVRESSVLSFRKPGVDDVRALVRGSSLVVSIPQRTALSVDQQLFVESLAKAVAATLPAGATAYVAGSLDVNAPEPACARVGEDLGRWYRDHGAYANDLADRYCLGPDGVRAFLKAVAEAPKAGPDRLGAVGFYTSELPNALGVEVNEAPLLAEQTIEGLTELARAGAGIERAAQLRTSDSAIAAAWETYATDCLDPDSRQRLLRAVNEVKDKGGAGGKTGTEGKEKGGRGPQPGTKGDGGPTSGTEASLTSDELRSFAEFVLTLARQIKSGEKTVGSLEEIVQAYRASMDAGVRSR